MSAYGQIKLAERIARVAHNRQDDGVQPYIEHPAAVVRILKAKHEAFGITEYDLYGSGAIAAAWLHDVLEDTAATVDDLLAFGVAMVIIEPVLLLTKVKVGSKPFDLDAYYDRINAHPVARAVKLADMEHNSDESRLALVAQRDPARAVRLRSKYNRGRGRLGYLTD